MAIINRNYLINQSKKGRDKSEKGGGARRVYYDKSCQKCGLPANDGRAGVLNKQTSLKPNKRAKCCVCGLALHPELLQRK